jgi:SAM-dependent methyltransferase
MAALYDVQNAPGAADEFFLACANRRPGSRVADLGCGTGSLTVTLARAGHTVTGVEPNPAFLDTARAKPCGERVTWIQGTSASLPTGAFDTVVMTGHVAQAFIADDEWMAVLADVRRALVGGGVRAFDARDPDVRGWEAWVGRSTGEVAGRGPFERTAEVRAVAGDVVTFEVDTILPDGERRRGVSDYRFRSHRLLSASLERAGFRIQQMVGGWRGEPIGRGCGEIVVIAAA